MSSVLPILMFSSLPASGKSESRRYLKSLSIEQNKKFHLGDTTTQVDDYPYVHAMKVIDDAANKILNETIFFSLETQDFKTDYDWGTLVYFINEDYADIKKCNNKIPSQYEKDPVEWLFLRFDVNSVKTGKIGARFFNLRQRVDKAKYEEFKKECYNECNTLLHDKYANIPKSLEGKTVVFEFARGGPKEASFPLPEPFGYQYSMSLLDDDILLNAAALYILVTPEMSYNKNLKRGQEAKEGKGKNESTQLHLTHGVAEYVMKHQYGCDDFEYLINKSEKKNYLPIEKNDKIFNVKAGIFDNRMDLTTAFRAPENEWTKEQIERMEKGMTETFDKLLGN